MKATGNQSLERFFTREDVARIFRVSTKTIDRMVSSGRFPQPIKFSRRCLRWVTAEIMAYIETLNRKPQGMGVL